MTRHRPALTTAVCLLSLAGIAQGAPVADQPAAPAPIPPADEVWGDPEDTEGTAPGWTWFGMGYERRNRDRAEGMPAVPDGTDGATANGRGGD